MFAFLNFKLKKKNYVIFYRFNEETKKEAKINELLKMQVHHQPVHKNYIPYKIVVSKF